MSDVWAAPVTVNVLTGFLGAGKTSLLKRLLRQPALADTAVLINEFGEVGIDHLLVEEVVDEEVVLLSSGCVCCTIRGDLKAALTGLYGRRQRGEVPPFTRLVIETTGLADPAPIVATLTADPMLSHHFRLGNVVTVVDAEAGEPHLDDYEEVRRQAAVADRLVITKIDIAPEKVSSLADRLGAMNPAAEILALGEEDAVVDALFTHDVHDETTRSAEVRRWLTAEAALLDGDHDHDHGAVDRNRHGDIRAMVITEDAPLDWAAFGLWLMMLLNRHGRDVLRVKGLFNVAGREAPVVVQGVQHLIHKPVHLDRWPQGNPRTTLVLIVRGLEPELIEKSFRSFMRLGAPQLQAASSSA